MKYCLEKKPAPYKADPQASVELSNQVTCHKPDECKTELPCAQPQVPVVGLPNHAEKSEKNNIEIIDESTISKKDTEFECEHCHDRFVTESSMRIHIAQCQRVKQQDTIDAELPGYGTGRYKCLNI